MKKTNMTQNKKIKSVKLTKQQKDRIRLVLMANSLLELMNKQGKEYSYEKFIECIEDILNNKPKTFFIYFFIKCSTHFPVSTN